MTKPYLSIVIPVYNEVNSIQNIIERFTHYFSQQSYKYELIIVDDGSTDGTDKYLKDIEKTSSNLRLLSNKTNKGKGFSVKRGMLSAKGQFRLFADADDSTSIDQIERLLSYFEKGFEVIIGSRAIPGSQIIESQSLLRVTIGKLGNFLIRLVLLPGIKDTQCGFKCFEGTVAEQIFSLQRIDRYGFDIEILTIARLYNIRIKEVPVIWKNNPVSHVKVTDYLMVIYDIAKIKRGVKNGLYL
jgi:dolichyl-phosphate beta-glucosyltransferase